jgi:hypothetical protein
MTDRTHLDELVEAADRPLSQKLVATFRALVRDPRMGLSDYATRLKAVMEERLLEDPENAASEPHHP